MLTSFRFDAQRLFCLQKTRRLNAAVDDRLHGRQEQGRDLRDFVQGLLVAMLTIAADLQHLEAQR